jgi:phosphoenolpyruvate carboxylase
LIATGLLERIIRTISAFGLIHATMDVREHSQVHHAALSNFGIAADYSEQTPNVRFETLIAELAK